MSTTKTTYQVGKRWKHWVLRLLLAGLSLLCVAVFTGATYELLCERRDERRFPQEGRSVDAGGFRLNIHCTGTGRPAVILDSGMGIPAMGWDLVQPSVEKFTQVCSYDRAGYGWSDPGPLPRTSGRIAKELHALLQNAGVPPPYILVGHSFGGFNVRVYNGLYPNEVAGMVLVDASHEDEHALLPAYEIAGEKKDELKAVILARLYPALFHLGVARWFLASDRTPLPEQMDSGLRYLLLKPKHIRAMVDEGLNFNKESAQQVRKSGHLGDKPLIVLTASDDPPDLDLSAKDRKAYQSSMADLQRNLAQLSARGRQVVVKSGHLIPFEQPTAVRDAIRSVFDASASIRQH